MTTNTVIITFESSEIIKEHFIDEYVNFLKTRVLSKCSITDDQPLELSILPQLCRLVVVSPTPDISAIVADETKEHAKTCKIPYTVGFSLFDTPKKSSLLQLPEARTIHLVSPPQSPAPEFDFNRIEEKPSQETAYPIFSNSIKSGEDGVITEDTFVPDKPYVIIDNAKVARVVIYPCEPIQTPGTPSLNITSHTMLPPRSIFDED